MKQALISSLWSCAVVWLFRRAPIFTVLFLGLALAPSSCFAKDPPFGLPPKAELLKLRSAIISTSKGEIYFALLPETAPWHVANFKYLADKGFYRNLPFHLFDPNFFIQGGAPLGKLNGGPGYSLPAEFSAIHHTRGILGMARLPDIINSQRRSNGSQFHIILNDAPHMDGSYTIFGRMTKGNEVLSRLEKGDLITDIKVFVAK